MACLGNPGPRYAMTWHNAGFWTADILAREAGSAFRDAGLFMVAEVSPSTSVVKPMVYMNRSGRAVGAFLDALGAGPDELLVVCDDIALDLGRMRLRAAGSSGGHNGLGSIIEVLGTDSFARLRLGVGPAPEEVDLAEYVLSRVPGRLEEEAAVMAHRGADCVSMVMEGEFGRAQEMYNRRPDPD